MKTFVAHSDGKVLVPEGEVTLSRGARYRVSVELVDEPEKRGLPLTDLALELAGKMKGKLPSDLAKNHDHYLHGRPKR